MKALIVPRTTPTTASHGEVPSQRSSSHPSRTPPTILDEMVIPTERARAKRFCSGSADIFSYRRFGEGEGTGEGAKAGDSITVNYVGVLSADGSEFDNSYDRGQPFTLTLGAGGVIAGWDQGLVGAKVGGRRQLDIPAELAYGDAERSGIPANSALTFVVDILAITPAG